MTLKLVSFNRTARLKRSPFEPLAQPAWLLTHLNLAGMLGDAYDAWHAWPTLETATFKLSRMFGQDLKTHSGKGFTVDLVIKAIQAFKIARQDGATLNSAATSYIAELLKAGEILITNRIEGAGADPTDEISLWDMTLGPFDEWAQSLPKNYHVSVHRVEAFEGEYKAGRLLVAGLILTPTDYACLVYPSTSSTRGDM